MDITSAILVVCVCLPEDADNLIKYEFILEAVENTCWSPLYAWNVAQVVGYIKQNGHTYLEAKH